MSRYRSSPYSPQRQQSSISISVAINDFLAAHRRKGDSDRYVTELESYLVGKGHRSRWEPLQRWCEREAVGEIRSLTKNVLERFLDDTRERTSAIVYGKVCAIVMLFLKHVVSEDILPELPLHIRRPRRIRTEIRTFTQSEMIRLRDFVANESIRDQAIFMLLADTGIRSSELCSLRISDFRWDRRELVIRPQIAKSRTARIVPIAASLTALQQYRRLRTDDQTETDAFFLSYYSTPVFAGGVHRSARRQTGSHVFCKAPLTRVGLYQLVKKWGRLANVTESRCSPHTFRHYFASGYLRSGGDILSLQRILGHTRLDVTERYLKIGRDDVAVQHGRFSPALSLVRVPKRRRRLAADQ